MNDNFVLFYHPHCGASTKFLNLIKKHNREPTKSIDISHAAIVPKFIKEVPHIMINNTNHLSGKACFDWLEEKSQNSIQDTSSINIEHSHLSLEEKIKISEEHAKKRKAGIK